ncbi:hypothetical protein SLA2020_211190 [Shorea laevis]
MLYPRLTQMVLQNLSVTLRFFGFALVTIFLLCTVAAVPVTYVVDRGSPSNSPAPYVVAQGSPSNSAVLYVDAPGSPSNSAVPTVIARAYPPSSNAVPYLDAPGSPSNSAVPTVIARGYPPSSNAVPYVLPREYAPSSNAVPAVSSPSSEDPLKPSPSPVPTAATTPSSTFVDNPEGRKNQIGLLVGIVIVVCALIFAIGLTSFIFWRKRIRDELVAFDVSFSDEFGNGMGPRKFSYDELAKATKNFADEEKLGEGGFGAVYKGFLRDSGTDVAVKRVSRGSKQGIKEYESEVKIISRLRHKNLVKLIGWCHEKELLLAYEFMPNGSLDSHLFKGRSLLQWNLRYKIVQGLASALLYLHEEGDFCVLHRDIKTSNIMLDVAFNAKLGDFGLARLADHEKGSRTTLLAGTMGYMAPECHRTGKASKESDIYSFGVVALEIACGRRSIEPRYEEDRASLVAWVWQAYGNRRLLDVVDD